MEGSYSHRWSGASWDPIDLSQGVTPNVTPKVPTYPRPRVREGPIEAGPHLRPMAL